VAQQGCEGKGLTNAVRSGRSGMERESTAVKILAERRTDWAPIVETGTHGSNGEVKYYGGLGGETKRVSEVNSFQKGGYLCPSLYNGGSNKMSSNEGGEGLVERGK